MQCQHCQSIYGQTVNVRDGGKAEWKCRDCKAVQPWVDEPARTAGLRPAKLADLASPPWEYEKCPFCGCRNVGAVPLPNTNDCFSCAKCGGCGAKGPPGETLAYESVREAWNHRYPKPSSKRPAWIEAAARELASDEVCDLQVDWTQEEMEEAYAAIIEKHWRGAK